MKMAIVLDQLIGKGGTERVAQYICEAFPGADVFALVYNADTTFPEFGRRNVRTTWLNPYVQTMAFFRWSFPIATYVMQSLNLSNYDVVISWSATVAKYIRAPNGTHICYCCIPTRALWHFGEYFGDSALAAVIRPGLGILRNRDYRAAQRVDKFIAISDSSRQYIMEYYGKAADIIHCPVDLNKFHYSGNKKEHYLIVSRLDRWKKIEYALEAFNGLGDPLRVIGSGPEEVRLRAMARSNITFLGSVDDETLAREYSEARAVIFPPFLEYGLIPLEAVASGTPVICYGKGGVTETMVPVNGDKGSAGSATALFFYEQTADALVEAIRQFESCAFNPDRLVEHAARWSVPTFKRKMRDAVLGFVNRSA